MLMLIPFIPTLNTENKQYIIYFKITNLTTRYALRLILVFSLE